MCTETAQPDAGAGLRIYSVVVDGDKYWTDYCRAVRGWDTVVKDGAVFKEGGHFAYPRKVSLGAENVWYASFTL